MVSIKDVPPTELIEKTAEKLKKIPEIRPPEWARFVKTGRHKQRPPVKQDWWYTRAAAVLRTIAVKLGPIGVSKLRRLYGGRANRGHRPDKTLPGSGSIIRKILQQLEAAKLLKKEEKQLKKGRKITPKGISILEKTAGEIWKTQKPAGAKKKANAQQPAENVGEVKEVKQA